MSATATMPTTLRVWFNPSHLTSALKAALQVVDKARTNGFLQVHFEMDARSFILTANSATGDGDLMRDDLVDLSLILPVDASYLGDARVRFHLPAESARTFLRMVPKGNQQVGLDLDLEGRRLTFGSLSFPLDGEAMAEPDPLGQAKGQVIGQVPLARLLEAVSRVEPFRRKDTASRTFLALPCLKIEPDAGAMRLVTTDGNFLATELIGEGQVEQELLLPAAVVALLPKVFGDGWDDAITFEVMDKGRMALRTRSRILRFTPNSVPFPSWRKVYRTSWKHRTTFDRKDMLDAFKGVMVLAKKAPMAKVFVSLSPATVTLHFSDPVLGDASGAAWGNSSAAPETHEAMFYATGLHSAVEAFPKGATVEWTFDGFPKGSEFQERVCRLSSPSAPGFEVHILGMVED